MVAVPVVNFGSHTSCLSSLHKSYAITIHHINNQVRTTLRTGISQVGSVSWVVAAFVARVRVRKSYGSLP